MSRHGDRRGHIDDFRGSFETINWLYLLFKCGIKTKTHFEWLLWHWSSLGQLNLEPTRPNEVAKCQLTSWRSVSKKPSTWVFIILHHIWQRQLYLSKPMTLLPCDWLSVYRNIWQIVNNMHQNTVYLKKYVFDSHFVMFCCGLVVVDFIYILQGYFTDTGQIKELSECE